MRRTGRLLLIALALACAILLALYYINFSGSKSAAEIRDNRVIESEKASSYSYSTAFNAVASGYVKGAKIEFKSSMEGSGVIDLKKRFMYTPVSVKVDGSSDQNPIKIRSNMEMYVVNNTLYTKFGEGWIKQELNEDTWKRTQLNGQTSVVKNASVKLSIIEDYKGKSAYVLEYKPGKKELTDYLVGVTGNAPLVNVDLANPVIMDYNITEWISTESYLPLKTLNKFTIVSGGISTNISILTEYYDYGKVINEKLPEGFSNAVEA
jgi:hypothetical protein